ncbi:UNVERIFIED_CONTAM: hypothetical protein NCL1_25496 [Trichonephila clavipes]
MHYNLYEFCFSFHEMKSLSAPQQPTEGQGLLCPSHDLGHEAQEKMFRSGSQPDAKLPVLSSQENLALIYRPIEGIKG